MTTTCREQVVLRTCTARVLQPPTSCFGLHSDMQLLVCFSGDAFSIKDACDGGSFGLSAATGDAGGGRLRAIFMSSTRRDGLQRRCTSFKKRCVLHEVNADRGPIAK